LYAVDAHLLLWMLCTRVSVVEVQFLFFLANKLLIQMRKNLLSKIECCAIVYGKRKRWLKPVAALVMMLLFGQIAEAQFTVEFDKTDPLCFGQPTGSVTAIPIGGQPPFQYLWNTGDTEQTLENIPAGLYTVTVTDDNSYTVIKNVELVDPPILNVDLQADACELPITITATGSGGVPPYEYNWNITGQSGPVVTAPGPGTYCVTMTDQNLCGAVECITVDFNPLNVDVTATDISCPGEEDGSVQATPSGGTPPYTYNWSNGATTASQNGLFPGTYSVTVTDAEGCTATGQATVNAPPPLTASISANGPACIGDTNGSATASAMGGTPPYAYLWSTGATSPTILNLGAGTYSLTVTDNNNCTTTAQVTLTPSSDLDASVSISNESCPDESDGTATANPIGGVAPYSYQWSSGQTTQTITALVPGSYTVTITDGQGCSATASGTVDPAAPFTISISSTDVTICDGSNGTATANIVEGEGPFTYQWSNGDTTQAITGLSEGVYSVTATDANDCTATASVIINAPPDISVNITTTESTVCEGENTGSAIAVVSGGTPPFSYLWNTGATTAEITGLGPGTYTVTVTDDAQCQAVNSVTIEQAPQLFLTVSGQETVCEPEGTGFATATPSGGTPPYTYEWSNGATTATVSDLPSGTYFVTVTDNQGCTVIESITIDVVDDFILDIGIQDVLCFGDSTGSILAEGWGGTPPYTYEWSNGVTGTPMIENLPAGNYSVTVTEQNGCQIIEDFVVNEPPMLEAMITADDQLCPDETSGMAIAMAVGGTPPYSYEWNTGATSQMIANLGPGTYTVTVTDDNDCEDTASVTIDEAPAITVVATGTETICDPEGTGSATAVPSGGTPPFSYEWSNGETTQSITDLPEGTYTVTVTDELGCTATDDITINIIDDFILDIGVQNVLCLGDSSGSILAEGWGGTPPYIYEWSNGATGTPMIENLPAGDYSVTVTEQNGCQLTEDFTITEPPLLVAEAEVDTDVCPGEATGEATASASGGTPPYSFEWSTGATTPTISGLAAGTYTVTVTDDNDCTDTASITIEEFEGVVAVIQGTEIVCGAGNTGSATATVSSGTPPFSYLWSTGATTQSVTGLEEGTVSVTVTDANGCTDTDELFIDVIDDLAVTGLVKDALCFGEASGEITAMASGGTSPYSYEWSTGETTATISNLSAGTYTVTATDANDCTAVQTFSVGEPPAVQVNANAEGLVCPGENSGTAMAMASGGTPPYSYEWSNGEETQTVSGLPAGTYTVTATDANNCEASAQVTLEEAPPIEITIDAPEVVCGDETGFASAEVSGGAPPYFYNWSTGESGEGVDQIENLAEGSYFVTVTDANGCSSVEEVFIEIIDDFSVSVSPRDVLCAGGNSGGILLIPSGGEMPYTYQWSTGDTTNEIVNLTAGDYSYTVTEANDCQLTGTVTIEEPPALDLNLIGTDIECAGEEDGQAIAEVSGGTPGYTYEWSNGAETAIVTGLSPGDYSVTVTDANFCTASASVSITEPEQLAVDLEALDVLCFGDANGSIASTVSGGTMPYSFNWSNGATTEDLNNLTAGTYSLTVTDGNGCTASAQATVEEPEAFTVSLEVEDIFCDENETGSITAIPMGGTGPYSYEWSNSQSGQTITGLGPGEYTVTVTDLNECTAVATDTVELFPGLELTPIASAPDCFGENTGAAAVSISGGTGPFTYEWNNGSTAAELIDIPAGVYTVTVTDAVGCKGEATVGIAEPSELVAQVSTAQTEDVSCEGGADGQATVEVTGGTEPYDYDWSNGDTTATITGLMAGSYDVTVTDANGCSSELSVEINEPEGIDLNIQTDVANTCENATDGAVTAMASGGTPPFTYEWSNAEEGASLSGLAAGTYTVTVTDANECTAEASVIISEFPAPTCSIQIVNEVSVAGNDGELMIQVSGGTAPFSYLWEGGQTTQSLSGLSPGDYASTVTDANGCETSCSVTLEPPARLGDFVWLDEDRDGIQDPDEPGIEGVMVILQIPGNNPMNIDTTFTDADGFYFFNVTPGQYKVQFELPDGLIFTDADQGTDDALDSDPDPDMGMTGVYDISPGEEDLTIDAGMYTKCDNIDDPGLIGPDQFLCGPGNDPDPIINIESPSGGSGELEYLWMKSTIPGPFNVQTWEVIPGADGPDYDPGPLSETTYFARCARRECCTVYLETNIVTVEVGNVAVAEINGPDFICVGEPTTFFAGPTGADAEIEWSFSAGVSPQTATGPQVAISVNSPGIFTITLQVTENGCTSTDVETVTGTDSPIYCANSMPLVAEVTDEAAGNINIHWMTEEFLSEHHYTLEYSSDGQDFEAMAEVSSPTAFLGNMNYYEYLHEQAKRGRNIYRVRIENPSGEVFYSEEAEVILYGDSKIALLYPNPVEAIATLELFETFGEEISVDLVNANGALIQTRDAEADTKQLQFDLTRLPSGTYFLRLNYSRTGVKVYKLVKR